MLIAYIGVVEHISYPDASFRHRVAIKVLLISPLDDSIVKFFILVVIVVSLINADAGSVIIPDWWCVGGVNLPSFPNHIKLGLLDLAVISLLKDLSFCDDTSRIIFRFSA